MAPYGFELELSLNSIDYSEINEIREHIADLYEKLEGERPSWVRFDAELKAEHEMEIKMNAERAKFEEEIGQENMAEEARMAAQEEQFASEFHLDFLRQHNERVVRNYR